MNPLKEYICYYITSCASAKKKQMSTKINLSTDGLNQNEILKLIYCKQINEIHEKGDINKLKERLGMLEFIKNFQRL